MSAACPVFGFLVELEIDDGLDRAESDALWSAFMKAVADRGLVADGGTGRTLWSYLIHSEAAQATDLDRTALEAWMKSRPEIVAVRVGTLFDLEAPV
jgi:uncharacterized protein YggL (DUF469 family)